MRGAAILQLVAKYANIAVQLVITAILARLVEPNDFGLLSIVTVFTAFFQLFSDMGIGVAIIQYRDLSEDDYGKLFVFSAILAFILATLFCIISLPISWFYGDKRLILLCCASAPALIFYTLNMVPNGLMLKDKRFGAIALRLICSTFISGLISILMAFAGAGCYALVAQTVLSAFIILVWNIVARPIHNLSIHFVKPLQHVFSYSAYQFGFSFINYFSRNLDNLVIGRTLGTTSLGYYDKAYKLTTYPMSSISSVVASVIQPYMAENQNQPKIVFRCWYKVTKLLSLSGAFIAAVFITSAPEIIYVFYGDQWTPAIPLFQALSVSIYFQMLGNPAGAFFQSLGRTDLMFKVGLINTSLTIAGLALGSVFSSLHVVAVCISLAFCLQILPTFYYLLYKGMGRGMTILSKFVPEILIAFIAINVTLFIFQFFYLSSLLMFVFKIISIGIIMFTGYALTGQLKQIQSMIKK